MTKAQIPHYWLNSDSALPFFLTQINTIDANYTIWNVKVMEEIEREGIKIYPLPDCDSDEDEDYKEQVSLYMQ